MSKRARVLFENVGVRGGLAKVSDSVKKGTHLARRLDPRERSGEIVEFDPVSEGANLRWNQQAWGPKSAWTIKHSFGYRWSGGTQQLNSALAPTVGRYLLPHLGGRHDLDVLEIGCGAGRLSSELARVSRRLVLADTGTAGLKICDDRFQYLPNVETMLLDGTGAIDLDDEFDLIASYDTFIHVAPTIVHRYVDTISRLLKPGGLAWLHFSTAEDWTRHRAGISEFEMRAWAKSARLHIAALEIFPRDEAIILLRKPMSADEELSVEYLLDRVASELEGALAGTSEWNRSRIPVIQGTFQRLLQHVEPLTAAETDLPILEIGCDGQLASAKVLHRLTGLPVMATNIQVDNMADRVGDYPIEVRQNDVGRLDFPDNSFSMIYGRAVLEHISEMDDFLAECRRVVQDDGIVYLDGGPLYFSPKGHHMAVRGPSGTHYGFDVMPDLLPDWCQLDMNEESLAVYLKEVKQVVADDADVIAHYVYNTDEQNRMSASEVLDSFNRAGFSGVQQFEIQVSITPPQHLLDRFNEFDLITNGLAVFAIE